MMWLVRLVWRRRLEQELAEEIRGHLDEKIEDLIAGGLTRPEATVAARKAFGNVTLTVESGRDVWGWPVVETWWADARYAVCQLYQQPAFTVVALLSTALGIGAATALLSVWYAVLINPYPYRDPGRLVHLHVFDQGRFLFDLPLSSGQFQQFQRSPVVDSAMAMDVEGMTVTGGDLPASVNAGYLSPQAFTFLGVPPQVGRVFMADDTSNPSESKQVVVLSYGYWQAHYGGQLSVVGRMLQLDHESYVIIGVMPRRFAWWNCDVYLPLRESPDPDRLATVFARLKPGMADALAQRELQTLVERLARERPRGFPPTFKIQLLHMNELAGGHVSGALRAIGAAVGLLWIIGCANVSILLLARGTTKAQELATRVALGASRGRIVRQVLTESVLISLAGGLVGGLLAYGTVDVIPSLLPASVLPAESVIRLNGPVLLASAALTIVTGVLCGLGPALHGAHPELPAVMQIGSRTLVGTRGTRHSHNLLIAGQVALTVVLVAGAGATGRAFNALLHTNLGYDPRHVASIRVDLRDGSYPDWHQRVSFYDQVRRAIAGSPGVVSVAVSLSELPPATPFRHSGIEIPGEIRQERPTPFLAEISPEYFATLHIPVLRGRPWTESETRQGAHVAVINSSMARHYWPDRDPLRQLVHLTDLKATTAWALAAPDNDGWLEIVGVAADTPNSGLRSPVAPVIYIPYTLVIDDSFRLIARSTGDPLAVVRTVAERIHAIDPDQPVTEVRTATDLLEARGWAFERFTASLFRALAWLAILLSATGLYSVVSYVVSRRGHDFGLRMALGARRIDVVLMVVTWAIEPMAFGVAAGLGLTVAVNSVLARWTQASVRDPYVLAPVVLILFAVTTLAVLIPACRAASINPANALRTE